MQIDISKPTPKLTTPKRTFQDVLRELQPQLNKLPQDQKLPLLPPDQAALDSVQSFLKKNGLIVADSCPQSLAIGGELLNRAQLHEGRLGIY